MGQIFCHTPGRKPQDLDLGDIRLRQLCLRKQIESIVAGLRVGNLDRPLCDSIWSVTLPTSVRQRAGVNVGDILEARVEGKTITLTPKSIIDRELALALEDIKKGRVYGPFNSIDGLIRSLRQGAKKVRKAKAS